ncbi:hypothetical protein ACX1DX_13155 [Tessaracoccus sp. Y36]
MKQLNIALRIVFAAAAALQLVLAVAVLPRAWWISLLFLAAAALLGRGALRGCRRNLILGSALAVIAPLAVGLSGVEPIDIWHHVVRILVLAGILGAWLLSRPSAPSPAPSV